MIAQEARIAMKYPARMISKLCKHFRHKVPAEHDDRGGQVNFQPGLCWLLAEAGCLRVRIEGSDDKEIGRMQYVLEDHMRRFSRGELLTIIWLPRSIHTNES